MPIDIHGQVHAGSLGLFDDDNEHRRAVDRAERREREYLEKVIRREERREDRIYRKDVKTAERVAAGKPAQSWFSRIFHRNRNDEPGENENDVTKEGRIPVRERGEYVIVRKPPTPEPVYTEDDMDPVDSPWLNACGMVRVKSTDPGGCHIVPKSSIQKSKTA